MSVVLAASASRFPDMDRLDQLRTLVELPGPSGHEDAVIAYMRDAFATAGVPVEVDFLGNVIARVPGTSPDAPRVMVFAHMDEIGLLVRRVEPDGFLRVERLGGVPERALAAQRVLVHGAGGPVPGVVGVPSHHLTAPEDRARPLAAEELYVDIGAHSREEVLGLGIRPGTPITLAPQFTLLRNGSVSAKTLDDRAGLWVLLRLLERLRASPVAPEVVLVATVQEEFHLQGALPAAKAVQPDLAICVDIAAATDAPDLRGRGEVRLGGGPVVETFTFHARGTLAGLIPNPRLVEFVASVAAGAGIPIQYGVFRGGLTDASYLHLAGRGVPAIDLGFPTRYTHAVVETASLADLLALVDLLHAVTERLESLPPLGRG